MDDVLKFDSILDKSIVELESIDIDVLRKKFLEEIQSLSWEVDFVCNKKLQNIFEKLFDLQPELTISSHSFNSLSTKEQRLYADLVSTPGLSNISYVRDFLEKKFVPSDYTMYSKKELLLNLFDFYNIHDRQLVDKFNYIFRSSDSISSFLLSAPSYLKSDLFIDMLNLFSKEDVSQLYKFILSDSKDMTNLERSLTRKKGIFMLSIMTKKINLMTGHSSEFLDSVLDFWLDDNNNKFFDVLELIYDSLIDEYENEEMFVRDVLENEVFEVNELIKGIVFKDFDFSISSLDEFRDNILIQRYCIHNLILRSGSLEKIRNGTFDFKHDFKKIDSFNDLENFKNAFLYNIYGINTIRAKKFVNRYCKYLDILEKDVVLEDKKIYSVLRSIKRIVDLDFNDPNFNSKLSLLQRKYYDYLVNGGVNFRDKMSLSIVLESLFNRMYINTYNKRLLKLNDKLNVLGNDNGVTLLDAGVNFNIMLTSFSGVNDFYDESLNMASKWNTASFSHNQGMCLNAITNENLGVIGLSSPLIGFSYIPECSLNAMGPYDIFSGVNGYNLRKSNDSNSRKYFVPGCLIGDLTRYVYNEFLVDRFLADDKNNSLKLQPDYVVFIN